MTFYELAKGLFRAQFRLMGWKVRGAENIPTDGPVIVVINHVSMWDPILVGCGISRQVWYMAKEELFKVPLLGWAIKNLGAFPVKRGQRDTSAIRQSLKVLKDGRILGIFPEGKRSKTGELQQGLPGMVLLMERSQAPVVPIRVYGTKHLLTKGWGKIGIVVGEPLTPAMLQAPAGVADARAWTVNKIMQELDALPER